MLALVPGSTEPGEFVLQNRGSDRQAQFHGHGLKGACIRPSSSSRSRNNRISRLYPSRVLRVLDGLSLCP